MMNGRSDGVPVAHEATEDMKSAPGEPVILNIYDMFWTNEYTGEESRFYWENTQIISKVTKRGNIPITTFRYFKKSWQLHLRDYS